MNRRSRTLQSAKYLQKKRRQNIINLSIFLISMVLLFTVLIVILKLPFLRIKNVEVEGVVALSGEELKEKADLNLAGKYLHIIPKSSSIFYPKEKIRKDILESFRKIKTLDIELKGLSTLKISVTEREPEIIVCEGFKEASNSDECFFADEGGYVYESTSTAIDDVYFKYYPHFNSPIL